MLIPAVYWDSSFCIVPNRELDQVSAMRQKENPLVDLGKDLGQKLHLVGKPHMPN